MALAELAAIQPEQLFQARLKTCAASSNLSQHQQLLSAACSN
jgi:hypothetical protein